MAAVTITLGGVELDPNLEWVERQSSQRVAQSEQITLGGGLNVLAAAIGPGVPITLQSGENRGFQRMTTAVVGAVRAMADEPGAVYELVITSAGPTVETYSVIFTGSRFEARPLITRIVPEVNDKFRVVIRLMIKE